MREVLFTRHGITKTEVMSKEAFLALKKDTRILILSSKVVDKKE